MTKRSRTGLFLFLGCLGFLMLAGVFFVAIAMMAVQDTSGFSGFKSAQVKVIKIEGIIEDSLKTLKKIQKISKNDNIKAVVVRVNSPGGAVAPSQEIMSELAGLKKKGKTVVASMGTVAASGGYYISLAADKIVASPGTITGSIGVILQNFGVYELADKVLIEPRTIKSGKYKDSGSPFREMNEDDKAHLQSLSDDIYNQFTIHVAEKRSLDLTKVQSELAQGKVYSGEKAKELGLIDELGSLYYAIDLAKKLAGLPEDAEVSWPKEPTPFEKFLSQEMNDASGNVLKSILKDLSFRALPQWLDLKSHEMKTY